MFHHGVTVFSGSPTQTRTSSALRTVRRTHKYDMDSVYFHFHNAIKRATIKQQLVVKAQILPQRNIHFL